MNVSTSSCKITKRRDVNKTCTIAASAGKASRAKAKSSLTVAAVGLEDARWAAWKSAMARLLRTSPHKSTSRSSTSSNLAYSAPCVSPAIRPTSRNDIASMPPLKTSSTAASRIAASLIRARVLRRLVNLRVPFIRYSVSIGTKSALDQVPLDGGSVTLVRIFLNGFDEARPIDFRRDGARKMRPHHETIHHVRAWRDVAISSSLEACRTH